MKIGKAVTIEAYYLYDGFIHLILNDGKERHYKVNVGNGHEDEAIDYISSLPQTASSINEIKNKWDLTAMNESKESLKEYLVGGIAGPQKMDYIRKVCDAMHWVCCSYIDSKVVDGAYACRWREHVPFWRQFKWTKENREEKAKELLTQIESKSGVKCSFDPQYAYLIIPFAPEDYSYTDEVTQKAWDERFGVKESLDETKELDEATDDYSGVPLIDRIDFRNKKVNGMPGIYPTKDFVKALDDVGEDFFKVRTTKFGSNLSDADINDEWMTLKRYGWSIQKVNDSSLEGFNEVYLCKKTKQQESLGEALNPEDAGVSSVFSDLIQKEYDLIGQYDSAQITLEDNGDHRFSEIFEYIKDDINIHIGMLQSCMEDLNGSEEQAAIGEQKADELIGESLEEGAAEGYAEIERRFGKQALDDFKAWKKAKDKATRDRKHQWSIVRREKDPRAETQPEEEKDIVVYMPLETHEGQTPWMSKSEVEKWAKEKYGYGKACSNFGSRGIHKIYINDPYTESLTLDESLFESRRDPEKEIILDAIDTFMELGSYDIDPNKFGTDSWEELRDQIEMGIDYFAPEIAQCIKDYLEKDIQFDKKHPEMFEEDPEAGIRQDIYDDMNRILARYE